MSAEIKETSATVRTIEITIPQDDLKVPFEKKLAQYKKQVTLKGFRQGQVPKSMILKQFGPSIRHEAVDDVVNSIVQDTLKKANINPVGKLVVTDFKDDEKADITLKVEAKWPALQQMAPSFILSSSRAVITSLQPVAVMKRSPIGAASNICITRKPSIEASRALTGSTSVTMTRAPSPLARIAMPLPQRP